MAGNAEPTLSPGRRARPAPAPAPDPEPTVRRTRQSHVHRATSRAEELEGLGSLVIASSILGIGAALIDSTYATQVHPFVYYYGWMLLAGGFGLVVWTFAENVLEPFLGYLVLIGVGVFGWWNLTWSILQIWGGGAGSIDSHGGQVILAQFGPKLPNGGLVEVPLWAFVVTTLVGLFLPPALYLMHHRRTTGSGRSGPS